MGKLRNEVMQLIVSFLFPFRIKKHNADLILSHSFMATRMAYYKKKKHGTPYIVILYHPPNFIYSDVKGWVNNISRFFASLLGKTIGGKIKRMDQKAVKSADAVIAISKYSAKRAKEIYGITPVIIYPQVSNFFRLMKLKEKDEFLHKKRIKQKFLLAHGRIIPDKNYSILADIMKNIPDTTLIISGGISKAYRRELENKMNTNGLQDRIKILGRISKEDLLGYYNCAEAFLLPAKKEDFGLTPVEAMACGCPVVAWDDGAGPSETVQDGINGLLAKPYNLEDFASKVKTVMNKQWDKKVILKSVKKFSEDKVAQEFIRLVKKTLEKPRSAVSHK